MRLVVAAALALATAVVGCRGDSAKTSRASKSSASTTGQNVAGLCVTHGSLRALDAGRFAVDDSSVRAVALTTDGDSAELEFRYLGPTEKTDRLKSGAVRQQVGVKLRGGDGCNVVYAMWRLQPRNELVVSVKENPGKRTHEECGTRGYSNLRPSETGPLPALHKGDSATLSARLGEGSPGELIVEVNGTMVWRGDIGAASERLTGPAGIRTDNVAIEATFAGGKAEAAHQSVPGCEDGGK